MTRLIIALMATALMTGTAYAQDDTDNKRDMGRRAPPEAALEACASSAQGDPCSFESRRDDAVEGTCEAQGDKPLACRPDGGKPEKGRRGPPEAALEACASSVQGDPCSFEGRRDNAVEGTCQAKEDKPLACRPEGGKRKGLYDTE